MMVSASIPDGIYDNLSSLQRERYKGGKLVSFITLGMLLSLQPPKMPSVWYKEWLSYPNIKGTKYD